MAAKQKSQPSEVMVVNDLPGDECRIAILEDGHLEELYSERASQATNVGNIYKGRVNNVEPAIQAAFIDYGKGVNGFLHVSDLHPRYFPGKDRTESVGKKIPRRERPLIQEALRRGDEVLVQVLKEGVGTKGPTLTSYLSIPGRLIVAMPGMDRVGVSRKVEDEDSRREMRRVLDGLDLPDGFGFILRTAGIGRVKTELKRDVAYLMRLWKVIDKRRKTVPAPCELYTESDLLVRTVRDVLRPSIESIIVDCASAYKRVTAFLSVVAPRSSPKVVRYRRPTPIFHAFDIERQIELIHNREVPLPSGGHLVFEQTEALVAIDVNSGRSRGARDSETNAYHTNCEAVDEICRQLRLRDLGGLIINDLIDMRMPRHRRLIEDRFRNNLRRDRARSTILKISEFGLIEMTRQRMRPSLRKSHFISCPTCRGHGEIKSPESVASDVTRQVGFLLDHNKVRRVEIVCSPRVASVLLSRKRRELVQLEEGSSKHIDVRVSDDIAADRIDYYAYDGQNADIDIRQLPAPKAPSLKELEAEETAAEKAAKAQQAAAAQELAEEDAADEAIAQAEGVEDEQEKPEEHKPRRRSRRRRRERPAEQPSAVEAGPGKPSGPPGGASKGPEEAAADRDGKEAQPAAAGESAGGRRRRRRRRRRGAGAESGQAPSAPSGGNGEAAAAPSPESKAQQPSSGAPEPSTSPPATSPPATSPPATSPPATSQSAQEAPRGAMRVHQLAKELNIHSRELLQRCEPVEEIKASTHMSSLTPQQADLIRSLFAEDDGKPVSADDATPPAAAEAAPTPAQSAGDDSQQAGRPRRRRRGGRRRGRDRQSEAASETGQQKHPDQKGGGGKDAPAPQSAGAAKAAPPHDAPAESAGADAAEAARSGKKRKKRRKRSGGESPAGESKKGAETKPVATEATRQAKPGAASQPAQSSTSGEEDDPSRNGKSPPKRRRLYRNRRTLSGAPRPAGADRTLDDDER